MSLNCLKALVGNESFLVISRIFKGWFGECGAQTHRQAVHSLQGADGVSSLGFETSPACSCLADEDHVRAEMLL